MKVEFTKKLTSDINEVISLAIKERADNLKIENPSDEIIQVLGLIKSNSKKIRMKIEYSAVLQEMAAKTSKLWNYSQTLKVFFFGGENKRNQRVLDYASTWSKHCSIKFQATSKIEESQIRIDFQEPSSWSYIGTDALGVSKDKPTVNFGCLNDYLPERDYKQIVLHEFGHVLGLIHEHQSPTIKIDWNKDFVYNYFLQNHNWTKEAVELNIFKEFEIKEIAFTALDTKSIMGYCIPPEFTNDGIIFPVNYELSEMDKQHIGKLYPHMLYS